MNFKFWKKKKHDWEYLPYFTIIEGTVLAVMVCKKTGVCQYIHVPSAKKLRQIESEKEKE